MESVQMNIKKADGSGPVQVSGALKEADGSSPTQAFGPANDSGPAKYCGAVMGPKEFGNLIDALMDSSSSSSSSSDEFIKLIAEDSSSDEHELLLSSYEALKRKKRNSIKNYIDDVIPTYTAIEFKHHFRISKELFKNMSKRINDSEFYQKLRTDKRLPATTYLAVFLYFAGHEACSFRDLAHRFNICIATISRIIEKVTMFISSLSPDVIKWPNEEKKIESAKFFLDKCGFSKTIGCIDGTHIVIDPPKERKDDYLDRKGNHTICMQGVCNEQKKFIDVFIGHPGSSHDSWVFQNSSLCQRMASACGDYYLLGDSAYGCTQYLLTPYKDNGRLTSQQINFNVKLNSARVAIEHTFGILKQRFRQLYYCKLRGNIKLCHFIRSCCVLHNLANEEDLEFSTSDVVDDNIADSEQYGETSKGHAVRNAICSELANKKN